MALNLVKCRELFAKYPDNVGDIKTVLLNARYYSCEDVINLIKTKLDPYLKERQEKDETFYVYENGYKWGVKIGYVLSCMNIWANR